MFSSDPVVRVQDVTIFQGKQPVLQNLSFQIEKGEFAFLVGRTGSGKSSLLKTMYADLPLRLGDMSVAGFNIRGIRAKEVPKLRRKIGIIFQDFQLFPDRSVADNLLFVMRATGWRDPIKMKSRLVDVLMLVGLGSVEKKLPHQLSGGEQQRVVIARALLNEPMILIADEPTGNLDPRSATQVLALLREQVRAAGGGGLLITHSLAAARTADRVLVLSAQGLEPLA